MHVCLRSAVFVPCPWPLGHLDERTWYSRIQILLVTFDNASREGVAVAELVGVLANHSILAFWGGLVGVLGWCCERGVFGGGEDGRVGFVALGQILSMAARSMLSAFCRF
jgi:hypothetical protein